MLDGREDATALDPVDDAPAIEPVNSGSSEKYSNVRPPRGSRIRFAAPPRRTLNPLACASPLRSRPAGAPARGPRWRRAQCPTALRSRCLRGECRRDWRPRAARRSPAARGRRAAGFREHSPPSRSRLRAWAFRPGRPEDALDERELLGLRQGFDRSLRSGFGGPGGIAARRNAGDRQAGDQNADRGGGGANHRRAQRATSSIANRASHDGLSRHFGLCSPERRVRDAGAQAQFWRVTERIQGFTSRIRIRSRPIGDSLPCFSPI